MKKSDNFLKRNGYTRKELEQLLAIKCPEDDFETLYAKMHALLLIMAADIPFARLWLERKKVLKKT